MGRILVVTAWEPWRLDDGDSLILYHQLRQWAGAHELIVVAAGGAAVGAPPGGGVPSSVDLRTVPLHGNPQVAALLDRARSLRSGEPAHVHWVERPALLEEVRQAATGLRPDVVHLHGWGTAQLARLVPGVPTVHVAVDSWALGLRNRIVSPVHRVLDAGQASRVAAHEARHYPALGAVVVVAERDAAHIRAGAPGAQVHVVPNGVDAGSEPAPEAWKERPLPVIAFHGVFSTRANVDAATTLLRDVLPRIRAGRPDVRLLLIGKAFAPDLRGLAEDAGAEVREDVASVRPELERAAVYVAPLVSGSGIKNKVLEAMAAGLPVVTTRLGLDGIGAGDGVVEADHPEELADAALRLIREPGLAARTGRAGRERVRAGFGWDRNAGAIANIWDKMRDRA